ncbi:hypothetical protein ACTQ1O_12315 [Bilifractor sp. LCP21S3_A7]|uniref:hypothetical protein n=1 Tax=Bilifractor sp. LCP21S3_A7 TaxID=3438738 RepID=UPI003F8F751A
MEEIFKNLFEKISSYDLLNNFIPGAVFVVLADRFTTWNLMDHSICVNIVIFYVAGLIISRIGSLIIEPILRHEPKGYDKNVKPKKPFVNFAPYYDLQDAEKIDPKIDTLSMTNNVYRTFISLCLCLAVTIILNAIFPKFWTYALSRVIGCGSLMILFIFSYRKQTDYIRRRVYKALGKKDSEE